MQFLCFDNLFKSLFVISSEWSRIKVKSFLVNLLFNASISTISIGEVLMTIAPFFILASLLLSKKPLVSLLRGKFIERKSQLAIKLSAS